MDGAGAYIGPMVAWSVVTEQVKMANGVSEVVGLVSSTSTQEVNQNITMVSDASVETEGMAKDVMQALSALSQQAEMAQTHIMSFLQTIGVDR